MAQRQVTIMTDDLTGKALPDGAGETVCFSLDGASYEIDLDTTSAEKLRSALEPYLAAGRRVSDSRAGKRRRVKLDHDPSAVRAWASANGIGVSDRGRIPAAVLAHFEAAGN